MTLSDRAHLFLQHGIKPTTEQGRNALLDELRAATGKPEPTNCPYTPEQLDRIQRESLAAKKEYDAAFERTVEAFRQQREKRLAIEKKAAAKASSQPAPHHAGIGRGRATGTAAPFAPVAKKAPPAPAAPKFPTLERFEALKGDEAANFYRSNKRQILTEERDRKQHLAAIEKRANDARARTGKGFDR